MSDSFTGTAGLEVLVGGVDNSDIENGMSGGWSFNFTLAQMATIEIYFSWEIEFRNAYDTGEYSELMVSLDGDERVVTEGCMGMPKGTIAVIKQTSYKGRRIRLSFPGGGAFPAGVIGRTADGDAIERDLNCTWSKSGMATCP